MRNRNVLLLAAALPLAAAMIFLPLRARSQNAQSAAAYKCEVKIEERDGFRYITSNGIPDHATGAFPNPGNPNRIAPQSYRYRMSLKPTPAVGNRVSKLFGVAVNGVPFDPGTAELWNGNFNWHYEALSGVLAAQGGLGVDENLAHVQPNGAYHYHGIPVGILKKRSYKTEMVLVGWASDGYPVYGPYAYSEPQNPKSALKRLKSGYKLKPGERPSGANSPGGAYDGSFQQDFAFQKTNGDLDECNGRTGVTPEYPNGTYYYVLTDTFPFVPRQLHAAPDPSFAQGGPPPGGGPMGEMGGAGSVKAVGDFVYVLRGNVLYRYSADGLKLLGKTDLP